MADTEAGAPPGRTVLAKLKGEIAAAVSLGAGALLATGYGITAARLHSVHVPAIPALGALPTSYYLGEALEAGVIPLVLLLTIGAGWVAILGDGAPVTNADVDQPTGPRRFGRKLVDWSLYWPALALALIVCSWLIDLLARQGRLSGAGWEYWVVLVVVIGIVLALTRGLAQLAFGSKKNKKRVARTSRESQTLAILLVALTAIIGTSVVRVVNAYFLANSLPAAVVSANPQNCTFLGPGINTGHCYFRGYYFGESSQWVFLVWKPPSEIKLEAEVTEQLEREGRQGKEKEEDEEKARIENKRLTDRLLLIPRDDVLQIGVAEELETLP